MFSMFQKKPSENEAISTCRSLAKGASILLVLEGGNPKALMINIRKTGASVVENFKFQNAVAAFAEEIERRIQAKDYEDPRDGLGLPPEILGMAESVDSAERLVVSSEMKKLFHWNH